MPTGTSSGRSDTRQGQYRVPISDVVMKPPATRLLVATAMSLLPRTHRLRMPNNGFSNLILWICTTCCSCMQGVGDVAAHHSCSKPSHT